MTAEIVELGCMTKLDIPAEKVLRGALEAGLSEVVVVGYDKDGEFYFGSVKADGGDVVWLLELAKAKLLQRAI